MHRRPIAVLMRQIASLVLVFAVLVSAPALGQEPVKPASRTEATAIIATARTIVTPNGIELLERVRIGGIDQWVSIRGADRRNPVLLHIHGGPGYVSIPMSWWFGRGWEEYFTVVQWDQRAAGKTHVLTDPVSIKPTLTREQMVADTEEMASWVRKKLGKNKIFVLGHSWGSFLGLQLAQRHPEWLHAYIGVSQLIDGPENERRNWRFAIDAARASPRLPDLARLIEERFGTKVHPRSIERSLLRHQKNAAECTSMRTGQPSGSDCALRATAARCYRISGSPRRPGFGAVSPAWNESLDAGLVRLRHSRRAVHAGTSRYR